VGGEVRGNYATLLDQYVTDKTRLTMANGNLDVTFNNSGSSSSALSSIGVSSGKWYAEFTCTQTGSYYAFVGIASTSISNIDSLGYGDTYAYLNNSGNKMSNGSSVAYGATWTAGDVIGVALDLTAGTLTFYKNGTSQGQAYSSISGTYIIGCSGFQSWKFSANFGQRPFAYAAPSGFKALNTANLPAPVVTKPSTVFDTKLYTGNGSTQTISGLGFSPDLIWTKPRNEVSSHVLFDIVRGTNLALYSNATTAETTETTSLTAFNSDGFSLGANNNVNKSTITYAAWTWDAGTTTVSNTQGSITSSVRANATAGFSIISWTSPSNTNTSWTVGHGLNVAPSFYIVKQRSATSGWTVYHSALGATQYLNLSSTNAAQTNSSIWNNTAPTSTVFSCGGSSGSGFFDTNTTQITYAFAPVSGYSSFGSYTGNGSADGPFVYTGFRPRWLMVKSTGSGAWIMHDTSRNPYNASVMELQANDATSEYNTNTFSAGDRFDILSNGFKSRTSNSYNNSSGSTYIYAAFAESPFQYARAR
jgi:hypothetical protein